MNSTLPALITSADGGDRSAANTLFATLYDELHRLAQRELARQHGPANLGVTTLLHEAYLGHGRSVGGDVPRSRAVHGLRRARDARADHRRRAGPAGAEARGRAVSHLARHRRDAAGRESAVAGAASATRSTNSRRTTPALAELVDLKFFCGFSLGGNCGAARRLGADGQTGLGEGAPLSSSRDRVGHATALTL